MYITNDTITDVVGILRKLKFSNEQIRLFFINIRIVLNRLDTLEDNYEFYHAKMVDMGYSEYQIHQLAATFPSAIYYKFARGAFKAVYKNCVDSIPRDKEDVNEDENYFDKIQVLMNLGIEEKRIRAIMVSDSLINTMTKENLLSNINFYKSLGLTDKDVAYLETRNGRYLEFGGTYYGEVLEKLKLFGIDKHRFGEMLIRAARLKFFIEKEQILGMMKWALSKPLDYEKFGDSFARSVTLTRYSEEFLDRGFDNIMKLGFQEVEAGFLVSQAASILSISYDNLKAKFNVPSKFGVSEEDTKQIIIGYPAYFTLSVENLTDKFRIYKTNDLISFVIDKPQNLKQGADLIDARAFYLRKYYSWLSRIVYQRMVFTSEEVFKQRFNASNNYLKSYNR